MSLGDDPTTKPETSAEKLFNFKCFIVWSLVKHFTNIADKTEQPMWFY